MAIKNINIKQERDGFQYPAELDVIWLSLQFMFNFIETQIY